MEKKTMIIINPAAGAGSTRRKWPHIETLLRSLRLPFDSRFTEGKGHAVELARVVVSDGYNQLVAVGGDGTVHEVANGILQTPNPKETALGIICTGTGSDLSRSIGIPHDYRQACPLLTGTNRMTIDVGFVEYRSEGRQCERYFINCAGIGFDATVVAATEQLPKYLGGTIPYVVGLVRTFIGYRNNMVTFTVGNNPSKQAKLLSMVIANGRYFGGGMHVAPEAKLDDGLFDIVVIGDFGKLELLRVFPRVYKGTHLAYPKVALERGTQIAIESRQPFLFHADGEPLGEGPVKFSLVPQALTLIA